MVIGVTNKTDKLNTPMTNKEIKLKLKNLQAVKPAVLPNALWLSATRNKLVARAAQDLAAPVQGQLIAPVVLPRTAASRFMFALRPVMATVMVAGLAVIGWAAGVSTSVMSRPGNILYGLQNAAEQTQLTFAADPSSRAYLHLELAGRHANEVAVLAAGDGANRESDMIAAMNDLQNEITNVKQNLNEVNASKSTDGAAVAKAVDLKVAEINAVFGKTKNLLSKPAQQKANQVQAAADDVSLQAVAVLVADAKTAADKSDAASRVQQTIDSAEANIIEVTSTEAGDQAKAALKQAKDALASDNLAQAVAKVQESNDLANAATAATGANTNANANDNTNTNVNTPPPEAKTNVNANAPATDTNTNTNINTNINKAKIKAIDF